MSLADVVMELEFEDTHDFYLGCGGRRAPPVLLCMVAISFKGFKNELMLIEHICIFVSS